MSSVGLCAQCGAKHAVNLTSRSCGEFRPKSIRRKGIQGWPADGTRLLFLCWNGFALILTLRRPFNFALAVCARFRLCFPFLSTRNLILFANGLIEALFQLILSCFETLLTKALIDLRVDGSSK